jgi:hypothetical protein
MRAQLVFGGKAGGPAMPERMQMKDLEDRVFVHGAKAAKL